MQSIIDIFIRICEAVEAAHRVGVIHRDLKPSNIIVSDEGRPILLDFGHSTAPEFAGPSNLTISGEFLGTPAFASPEQVLCRPGTVDVRTDVYAIGVMLYQCLTGTFPYDVSGPLARTFEQIQYAEPTPPRNHVPWIDRDLQAIVLCMLAKQREHRYQTVSALRSDLERYLRGESVQARTAGIGYHLLKFLRLHKAIATSIAIVAAISLAYSISMTVLYRRATEAENQALANAADARKKFTVARETLDFVVSQIESRLDRVAGTREIRMALLEDCYGKLRALTELRSTDPDLRFQLAAVHRKLGDIARDIYDLPVAERERQASISILEQLVSEQPNNPDYLEALSLGHVLLGDLAKIELRWDAVLDRYQRAMIIDEKLAEEHPENDRLLDNLAWSYERMAGREWCPDSAAQARFRQLRHDLAIELVRRDPNNPARLHNLCISHLHMAKSCSDGHRSGFLDHVQAASELADRLVEAEPLNGQFAMTYAMTAFMKLDEPLRIGDVDMSRSILMQVIETAATINVRDAEGHWTDGLRTRANHAREMVRQLDHPDARPGADLRWMLPKFTGF